METICAYAELFHPAGLRVRVPFPLAGEHPASSLASLVDEYLAAGWAINPPGIENAGEERFLVACVVRSPGSGNGLHTLDFYSTKANEKKPFLRRYIDTIADAIDFERSAGLHIKTMPEYVGDGRLERGKNVATDKLIVPVPRPFAVIVKPNPVYNPSETDVTKKKPKYLFVRYPDLPPLGASPPPPASPPASPPPPPAKTPTATTPAVELHIKRIHGCTTGNELEMAKQLANNDKFITPEDRADLIEVIGAQLSKIQGDNPTEGQQTAYVEFLQRFGRLENRNELGTLGKDIAAALAKKEITAGHAADLRHHYEKADNGMPGKPAKKK